MLFLAEKCLVPTFDVVFVCLKGIKETKAWRVGQVIRVTKGDDGVCPDTCQSSYGLQGTPGVPGPAGSRGLPGVQGPSGHKGIKGDMGDLGLPGSPGLVGMKVEPGPFRECNCTGGADGVPGQNGHKGGKGEQGPIGPTGEVGPQGDKGNIRQMGMTGPSGSCMPRIQQPVTLHQIHLWSSPTFSTTSRRVMTPALASTLPPSTALMSSATTSWSMIEF